jgi:hypothetical protein
MIISRWPLAVSHERFSASRSQAVEDAWLSLVFSALAGPVRVFSNALPKLCALEELLRSQSALARLYCPLSDSLCVEHAGRRKLGKLAELLRKVNNLFLQIDRFSRGEPRQFHAPFRNLQLTA